jgi:hypothetical protein
MTGVAKGRRGRGERRMTVAEARAFPAALPQKDGRYPAALTPGAEALQDADVTFPLAEW